MSPPNDWDDAYDQLEELRLSAERSGAAPEDWANLPTKADVKTSSRRAAQAQQAAAIAAYRLAHPELNPQATDQTVWALVFIEQVGKSSDAATAAHSREGKSA